MKLETLGCVWVIVLALWFWVEVIKFGRISLDCPGCSGFFRSHWRSLYRFWGHQRAKKAMPQLAAALLFGRWPMHRYDHFLSTHIDSNTLVIAQWVKIIGDGLFVQAEELRKSLWEKDVSAKVYVGMRYWHPFTEEAIEQVIWWVLVLIFKVCICSIM